MHALPAPRPTSRPLLLVSLLATLAVAGCNAPSLPGSSASNVPPPPPVSDQGRLRAYAETLAPRYAATPQDKVVAIRYANALRGLGEHAQAVAVMQQLAIKYPQDLTVLGVYGKALADAGRLQEAASVLSRSHTPDRPNWTILSAQGSVQDQMGNHADAQAYYAAALKIVPNQPQVLSNLGLSYALEHKMSLAETTLRQAVAQPNADARVRQNLAMVLSAEGKTDAAAAVARQDMSPIDAAETVADFKRVASSDALTQADTAPAGPARARKSAPSTRTASIAGEE